MLGGAGDALAARLQSAPSPARRFVSRRDLRPPRLTIRHPAQGAAEGHLFIAPSSGPGQRGVLIFDNDGEPVWFHPTTPVTATDFRASTLRGKPVLTWWEGKYSAEGLGRGVYVIVDDSYREIARIRAGGHWDGDLHEFLLTSEGTALVTKNEAVVRDLTAYGGSPTLDPVRRRRSGDRHPERQSPVRVAQPRPHRAERVARLAEREPFRLLPHQLDRRRRRRPPARLGPEHLGGLQGAPPNRRRSLAPRRTQEQLRDGQGHRDCLAA